MAKRRKYPKQVEQQQREVKAQNQPASRQGKPTAARRSETSAQSWRGQAAVLGVALLLALVAYGNAPAGKFVYDDNAQIVNNQYIQHGQYFWKAFTADVWAFKGESSEPVSNYWRPLFVIWMSLNFSLFGLNAPAWHVANIILHLLVIALAYRVLLTLKVRPLVCAIAVWLFAVHPAHVESVTWISGSPDLLVSAFMLGSYLCYLRARGEPRRLRWAGALALYVAALLSKEIAVVFPAIIFGTELALRDLKRAPLSHTMRAAFRPAVPFLLAAALFIFARYQVMHSLHVEIPGAPSLLSVVLTAPSLLWFYVRQTFFPFFLGPTYGLRAVDAANLSLTNFVLPLLLVVALAYGAYLLWRRRAAYRIGLIWFLLPLAPVFDIRSFVSEDLAHNRYLYLPLLGALVILSAGLLEIIERVRRSQLKTTPAATLAVGGLLAVGLIPLTLRYNAVWSDDVALWEDGVRVDPSSALPSAQLGEAYRKAVRLAEARVALARALELNPNLTSAHVSFGALANQEGKYAEAAQHLEQVVSVYPEQSVAVEQLGLAYQQQGRLDEAIALFDRSRRRIPSKWASYTVNIAVLQRMANRSAQAQAELESLGEQLNSSTDAGVLKAWWYLGSLYREQGKTDLAARAFESYLQTTANINDPQVQNLRQIVMQALQTLRATGK
jgi:protein O-mannosyl-transferase